MAVFLPSTPSNIGSGGLEMHELYRGGIAIEREELLEDDGLITTSPKHRRKKLRKLGLSFFLFGLINNVLYIIILSAALDLVPPSTPKGIVAFCNIAPGFAATVGWPLLLKGKIRYTKRLISCCLMSASGMLVVAGFNSLSMRLLGICLASFSQGLGELTFLQFSTTYSPASVAGHSVGYFAAGTGAAGLFGAFAWWELRRLGVKIGLTIAAVLPFFNLLNYFFLLPPTSAFLDDTPSAVYTALPADDDDEVTEDIRVTSPPSKVPASVSLSASDKWRLVKPMLTKYILPLFCVYVFEYTINQGVAPTLLYPIPQPKGHPILSKIIHSIRDYYPLWQLVYRTSVFFSRSSISIGLPPLPAKLLPLPSIVQGFMFTTLAFESAIGFLPETSSATSIKLVFLLVSIEGVCGGLAYVNVFYHINQERPEQATSDREAERIRQEREFKIGSVGLGDTAGILFATILAIPTEVELCRAQIARGKTLCQGL